MNQLSHSELIAQLVDLSRRAGDAIMAIYNQRDTYNIQQKTDNSPLTAADLASHQVIASALSQLLDIPVISEEGELPSLAERAGWESLWLVDPLDGTKEFIAGNGEFTVNIALIREHKSVLGVVHVPVTDITYVGVLDAFDPQSAGAWKYRAGGDPQPIKVRDLSARFANRQPITALLSHRHSTQATLDLMAHIESRWAGAVETANAGSSLKFCMIAEGGADFYPRQGPTSEWDTGAAQAVLEAAGGRVVKALPENSGLIDLNYNAREGLLNPHFFALGDKNFPWEWLLGLEK